jgi:hypothetical protein
MMTVVDHARPWLIPRSTFAATTQPQLGAQMRRSGTGRPASHPAISTGLRPYRSDSAPAAKFVSDLTTPNARMKVSALV